MANLSTARHGRAGEARPIRAWRVQAHLVRGPSRPGLTEHGLTKQAKRSLADHSQPNLTRANHSKAGAANLNPVRRDQAHHGRQTIDQRVAASPSQANIAYQSKANFN